MCLEKLLTNIILKFPPEEWRRAGAIGKTQNIIGLKLEKVVDIGAGDGNVLLTLSEKNPCADCCS